MSEPFLGQIMAVGFNFAPRGWAMCSGQILSIAQNTALFSLLGTMYGGNGQTTFALPDLRGRVPIHLGQGPGLTSRSQGEVGGEENHTLLSSEMPMHKHSLDVSTSPSTSDLPAANAVLGRSVRSNNFIGVAPNASLAPAAIGFAGSGQPHNNMPPYLVVNYVICLEGIFPSRN